MEDVQTDAIILPWHIVLSRRYRPGGGGGGILGMPPECRRTAAGASRVREPQPERISLMRCTIRSIHTLSASHTRVGDFKMLAAAFKQG